MQALLGTLPSDYNRIIHYLFIIFISFIFYIFAAPNFFIISCTFSRFARTSLLKATAWTGFNDWIKQRAIYLVIVNSLVQNMVCSCSCLELVYVKKFIFYKTVLH